jgi:predicted secreted hydrolase
MTGKRIEPGRWRTVEMEMMGKHHRLSFSPFLRFIIVIFLLISITISPGLAENLLQFKPALPGWKYEFPRDHGAHRQFKTEWWYYNGHLKDRSGNSFGYQVTFFRVGLIPGRPPSSGSRWRLREVLLAHLAITDIGKQSFFYQEKADRGNLGLAGADENRYRVWVENWRVCQEGRGHQIIAGDSDLGLSLELIPSRPPVIHGVNGVSQKGAGKGRASHYYSLTRLKTKGILRIKSREIPVSGLSWMDHEFGSNQLAKNQVGWDWFSLQLDNGMDLMIYQLRRQDGGAEPFSSGTLVLSDFRTIHLPWPEIKLHPLSSWKSGRSGATYPASWEINLPQYDLKLSIVPWVADQELMTEKSAGVTYWEGTVKVKGTYQGKAVEGEGYVELTGYDRRFRPKI